MSGLQCAVAVVLVVIVWEHRPQMYGQVFASRLFKQAVEIKAKSWHIGSVSQQPFGQAAAVVVSSASSVKRDCCMRCGRCCHLETEATTIRTRFRILTIQTSRCSKFKISTSWICITTAILEGCCSIKPGSCDWRGCCCAYEHHRTTIII